MHVKRLDAMEFSYERDSARFSVVEKATDALAGFISYTHLEPRMSTTIGITIAKPFWGRGIALDAQEVLLGFLFEELGVRAVHLWTHSANPRAMGLAEKSGFRVTGRVREAMYKNGKLIDTLVMALLREEYYRAHDGLTDRLPSPVPLPSDRS